MEGEGHFGSVAPAAVAVDLSVHEFCVFGYDVEAESCALDGGGIGGTVEAFEEVGLVFFGDADSLVFDGEQELVVLDGGGDVNGGVGW